MSYRIVRADPIEGCTVELTNADGNARYFKSGIVEFSRRTCSGRMVADLCCGVYSAAAISNPRAGLVCEEECDSVRSRGA
jgi:hypothetical protein